MVVQAVVPTAYLMVRCLAPRLARSDAAYNHR